MCKNKSWKNPQKCTVRKKKFRIFFLLKFLHNNMLGSYNIEKEKKLFITYHLSLKKRFFTQK